MKENAILEIVGQILSAFLFLNSKNVKIVHRDIKDKNIIIWIKNKQIKILDFGLAKDIDSSNAQLSTYAGTPIWMAPEI